MSNLANPQSWDRYSYVSNNPLKYTDPTGHMQASDSYNDTDRDYECKSGDTSCNWTAGSKAREYLRTYRNNSVGVCFSCKPAEQLELPPDYTLPNNEPSISDTSGYYVESYDYAVNWSNMDWRHIASNGVGIVGDAATIAAILDPLPVVDDVLVVGIATGANTVGVAVDAYDIITENDFSGSKIDALLFAAQKTNALKRIVPVFGLGVHIRGLAEAIVPGITPIPRLAPIQ